MQCFVALEERLLGLVIVICLIASSFLSEFSGPSVGRSFGERSEERSLSDAAATPSRGLSASAQEVMALVIVDAPLSHDLPVMMLPAQPTLRDLQAVTSRPGSVIGWIMSTPEADAPTALPAIAYGSLNKGVISPPVPSPLLPGWMSLGSV